ncbi:MAG: bacillithiol biosynthesis deacetylase BshB1 [candidate division Zixibacteria bacterium]|nr:bacillithiol biosynthesis deacetylase BshB1 [candidate division Zixibacteria bacterium]
MTEFTKLDVLAIAAHRDDTEIVCGGTIIKMADLGYKVGLLDLTAGEAGSRGDAQMRANEADCAAKVMNLAFRHNLEMPDAGLFLTQENALAVADIIRKTTPEMVIIPTHKQRHPDHSTAGDISYRGCFLAGLGKMPLDGEPYRPRKIFYSVSFQDIRPTFIIDISDQFKRKCDAVACYKSQFEEKSDQREVYPPARNIFDYMEIQNRRYGYMIGVKYGEAYIQKEMLAVDDPLKLTGKSI